MKSPYGRGLCRECQCEYNINKDGTIRSHSSGYLDDLNCRGGGEPPTRVIAKPRP